MSVKQSSAICMSLLFFAGGITGCVDKKPMDINVSKIVEYTDRLGQANLRLYIYSGEEVEIEDIKAYTEKLGCNMLYAYFYPDTLSLSEIPVEEIRTAKTFSEAQDILFNGEGYAGWRFASRCFAAIPIVTDCLESRVSQNCR